jgi:ferredoxin
VQQLYEATRKKASLMCEELARDEKRVLKTSLWLRVAKAPVISGSTTLLRLVGKDIVIGSECNHCGLCVRNCPAGNIYEKEGRIGFGLSCNSCMRCIYSCPRKAMGFKHLGFFKVPGGYDIRAILGKDCDSVENGDVRVPPFFNKYIQDDAM